MKIITLDFETYYSKDFSLSKITTEEYIRSPKFEVIGVSVKVDGAPAEWFSGTKEQTKRFLDKFNWSDAVAVAHNAMFDMAILSWVFDIRPKRIADTMSMAKALNGPDSGGSLAALVKQYKLGEKGDEVINALGMRRIDFDEGAIRRYAAYCKNDTELTYKLFKVLAEGFPVSELRLIDLTIRMFSEPVLELDKEMLTQHLWDVQKRKGQLMLAVAANEEVLMSNPKFALALQNMGVEPPMKISPTTGKETLALGKNDEEFKALLEHEDVRVQALVAARLGVKSTLEETRTERFIGIAERGTLPIPLRYYAAHTGRWGGCLVNDTQVIVYNEPHGVQTKRIVDVLLDDLVWDGEEFVQHEGVVFSGFSEVIEWDGVKGTGDHVVFTDAGEMPLRDAAERSQRLKAAGSPTRDHVDAARKSALIHQAKADMSVCVRRRKRRSS